jgi:AcrR family transcriptional regulator
VTTTSRDGRYHHGRLPPVLVDAAIDVITERGIAGFSLAEVSRRAGVSVAAPYRHFDGRESLLAAVAMRACELLCAALDSSAAHSMSDSQQLTVAAATYVRFCAENRALFDALVLSGLDKSRYPELLAAAQPIVDAFVGPATALVAHGHEEATSLALSVIAVALGYTTLLFDGTFGTGQDAVEEAANQVAVAVSALINGMAG